MNLGDLRVGDVMLKRYFGGLVHWFIRRITSNEADGAENYVHAAIYLGNGVIAEAIGGGYSFTQLMAQGHNYRYQVNRYTARPGLAEIAAHVASTWATMREGSVEGYRGPRGFGRYGLGQAVAGAVRNRANRDTAAAGDAGDSLWDPGNMGSAYCSQFVVASYQAAGATAMPQVNPIGIAANRATPALLANWLAAQHGEWDALGVFVAQ